MFTSNKSYITL